MFRKVALGVSGGVDSAVAGLLLKRKGFQVEAVFMQNWDISDETGKCSAEADYEDATFVCDKLKINLYRVNFVKQYWNEVFCEMIRYYEAGYTPNPDILCNKNIKFNYFYKYAMENLNVDAIATGHYAQTSFGSYLERYNSDKATRLLLPKDRVKDQTFFLCQVKQDALRRTMFPLGDMTKSEVKQIAMNNDLKKIAAKPESMGICFIGSRNFQDFIEGYISDKPGDFIDIDTGKIVGKHRGLHMWTLGQRSRLPGLPIAYFVAKKDFKNNIIYLAQGTDHPVLFTNLFFTSKPHWIHSQPEELKEGFTLDCQFKFQHTEIWSDCEICQTTSGLIVKLDAFKRAITPGQYAVFARNQECLGSARIINSGISNFTSFYLDKRISNEYNVSVEI